MANASDNAGSERRRPLGEWWHRFVEDDWRTPLLHEHLLNSLLAALLVLLTAFGVPWFLEMKAWAPGESPFTRIAVLLALGIGLCGYAWNRRKLVRLCSKLRVDLAHWHDVQGSRPLSDREWAYIAHIGDLLGDVATARYGLAREWEARHPSAGFGLAAGRTGDSEEGATSQWICVGASSLLLTAVVAGLATMPGTLPDQRAAAKLVLLVQMAAAAAIGHAAWLRNGSFGTAYAFSALFSPLLGSLYVAATTKPYPTPPFRCCDAEASGEWMVGTTLAWVAALVLAIVRFNDDGRRLAALAGAAVLLWATVAAVIWLCVEPVLLCKREERARRDTSLCTSAGSEDAGSEASTSQGE